MNCPACNEKVYPDEIHQCFGATQSVPDPRQMATEPSFHDRQMKRMSKEIKESAAIAGEINKKRSEEEAHCPKCFAWLYKSEGKFLPCENCDPSKHDLKIQDERINKLELDLYRSQQQVKNLATVIEIMAGVVKDVG